MCALVLLLCASPASALAAERLQVCTLSLNSPDEVAVFKARLPEKDFEIVDLLAPPRGPAPTADTDAVPSAPAARRTRDGWLAAVCRNDMRCDVLVISAEFAGRFFGTSGTSLGLQEMEEASCMRSCQGLFHSPREVFLLACNTLATKDADRRTPEQYLQVLLDHGFDRGAAERVVAFRYGPLGPSFREALRRIFADVPRLYGFGSVAPRGEHSARALGRYFDKKGDYRRYLERVGRRTTANAELLAAFRDTDLVQIRGAERTGRSAADRAQVCSLFDPTESVSARLRTVQRLMDRTDFLAFLPSIEVFTRRHPVDSFTPDELRLFDEIRARKTPREQVLALINGLDVCALKMELANLAVQLRWMDQAEFRRLAIQGATKLVGEPVSTETVDIMCEISKHARLGDVFASKQLAAAFFESAEGIRFVDCLAPLDRSINARLLPPLDAPDVSTRVWAAYALTRRPDLREDDFLKVADHLSDPSAEVRQQLRWLLYSRARPASARLRAAVNQRDTQLARALRSAPLPDGGVTHPRR